MNTDTPSFPLPGWTRDWSKPHQPNGTAHFAIEDRGHDTPCWVWQGATHSGGYGSVRRPGGPVESTHRVLYKETVGVIPAGLHLDHLCRVRACCNPDHLEPVTPRENILRGVGQGALHAAKTHCLRGHPFSGDNLFYARAGGRLCRKCDQIREARKREKRRAAA